MSIGMQEQDQAERGKFESELKQILKASGEANILVRVIGSLAFQMHCPQFGYLQQAMGRAYTDIDFAAYGRQAAQISALMAAMGYTENREVYIASEGERAIYDKPQAGLHDLLAKPPGSRLADDSAGRITPGKNADRENQREGYYRHDHVVARTSGGRSGSRNNQYEVDRQVMRERLGPVAYDNHEPEQGPSSGTGIFST
jgi:hypothetical protein